MKEFLSKYGRIILYSLIGLVALLLLYKGANYIYKNSYVHERYQYASKSFEGQTFEQNVDIIKNIKHNCSQGSIKLAFDKKDLSEEYRILLDDKINPINVEVSIIGKIASGDMNVRMIDDQNNEVINKTVKGPNIKEISTPDAYSKYYKIIITPNNALGGDLEVGFKFK